MTDIVTTFEVWDGMGEMRLSTTDQDAAYKLRDELRDNDISAEVHRKRSWQCGDCGCTVVSHGGHDTDCDGCGARYNAFGQRLRDDSRANPSNYDDEISDMDGYEMQHAYDN